MTQYTDASLKVTVEGLDLNTISQPHMSFSQDNVKLVDVTTISILSEHEFRTFLTQEETGKFSPGTVQAQLNYFNELGLRRSSNIGTIKVEPNLLKKVLNNE